MKNSIKSIAMLFAMIAVVSCSKDVESPEVSFTADKVNVQVGENVTFNIAGDAQTYVVFTGDLKHEYTKSHLYVTAGLDLDQEEVVLITDSLVNLKSWLKVKVDSYNATTGVTPLNIETIMGNIETLVGKIYTNKETAAYEPYLFMDALGAVVARDMVNKFYQNHSVLLAPEGGFSTGIAINRYAKTYKYSYNSSGTYTVTLIATNVSDKKYSGSGYQDDRTSSADEYGLYRTIKELTITVQ